MMQHTDRRETSQKSTTTLASRIKSMAMAIVMMASYVAPYAPTGAYAEAAYVNQEVTAVEAPAQPEEAAPQVSTEVQPEAVAVVEAPAVAEVEAVQVEAAGSEASAVEAQPAEQAQPVEPAQPAEQAQPVEPAQPAEQAPAQGRPIQIPLDAVDATFGVGSAVKGNLGRGGVFRAKLTVNSAQTVVLRVTGMDVMVDVIRDGSANGYRYTSKDGTLEAHFDVTPGEYKVNVAPLKKGTAGSFTLTVNEDEQAKEIALVVAQPAETAETAEESAAPVETPAEETVNSEDAAPAEQPAEEIPAETEVAPVQTEEQPAQDEAAEQTAEQTPAQPAETAEQPEEQAESAQTAETAEVPEEIETAIAVEIPAVAVAQPVEAVETVEAVAAVEAVEAAEETETAVAVEILAEAPTAPVENAEQPAEQDASAQNEAAADEAIIKEETPAEAVAEQPAEQDASAQNETADAETIIKEETPAETVAEEPAEAADEAAPAEAAQPAEAVPAETEQQPEAEPSAEVAVEVVPVVTEQQPEAVPAETEQQPEAEEPAEAPAEAVPAETEQQPEAEQPAEAPAEAAPAETEEQPVAEEPAEAADEAAAPAEGEEAAVTEIAVEIPAEVEAPAEAEAPAETEAPATEQTEEVLTETDEDLIHYTFKGLYDYVMLETLLAEQGIEAEVAEAVSENEELLSAIDMSVDYEVYANAYFDTVIVTVTAADGETYRIAMHNPEPEPERVPLNATDISVELDVDVSTWADAFGAEFGVNEAEELAEDGASRIRAEKTGYVGLDISADTLPADSGLFVVPVTLPEPVDLLEGFEAEDIQVDSADFTLYHIVGDEAVPVAVTDKDIRDGAIYGFTFETADGFSPFAIVYTVSYTYVPAVEVEDAASLKVLTAEDLDISQLSEEEKAALIAQYFTEKPKLLMKAAPGLNMGKMMAAPAPEADAVQSRTDYIALNIDLTDKELSAETYVVPVTLPSPVNLVGEGEVLEGVRYELFHITDEGEKETIDAVTADDEGGVLTGFTFETTGFSTYVLKYTVDFTYVDEAGEEHTFSLNGQDKYALADILTQLGITFETIESAELELTEAVGDVADNALYLTGDAETGFVLHSDVAFDDVYTLTVVADGKKYVVTVTDASTQTIQINFFEKDGTTPTNGKLGIYNYIVANNNSAITDVKPISVNGTSAIANLQVNNGDSITLIEWKDSTVPTKETLSNKWWYDAENKLGEKKSLSNGTEIDVFTIQGVNNYSYKAVKKNAFIVNLAFVDHEAVEPVTPGVTEGAKVINEHTYARVMMMDNNPSSTTYGYTVGYAIVPISNGSSVNSVAVETFTKFSNPVAPIVNPETGAFNPDPAGIANVTTNGTMTYAQAKAAGYAVGEGGAYVRIGHKAQQLMPALTDFDTQGDGLSTGDIDGYTFAGQVRGTDERTVKNRIADPTIYNVKVDCGGEPLTIPSNTDMYALVHVTTSTADLYAYAKITADDTTDGGLTYTVNIPDNAWFQVINGGYMQGNNQISGHENNVSVSLAVVTEGTMVSNPTILRDRKNTVMLGSAVNTHIVESYPSINNGDTSDPTQRIMVSGEGENVVTDIIHLKKNDDHFSLYTLEKLLNGGYNVITLCPGTNGSMPKGVTEDSAVGQGDAFIGCHQMGSILIRGDITFASKVTGVGDSAAAINPAVVGGYFGATSGKADPFVHNRNASVTGFPVHAYMGSSNTVVGEYVNGTQYGHADGNKYEAFNRVGNTYINDGFVDWDRLQSVVRNSSKAMAQLSTRTITAGNNTTVEVNVGENVTIICGDSDRITVNVVGDGANSTTAPGSVINFLNTNSAIVPKLQLNGVEPQVSETGDGVSVVFNYPNTTGTVHGPEGNEFGHVVAPKALVDIRGGNYNGTMIGNNAYIGGNAEGHLWPYLGGQLIGFQSKIDTEKFVDGHEPLSIQKYLFELYELRNELDNYEYNELVQEYGTTDADTIFWEKLQSVYNDGHEISFKDVNFYLPGVYYLMLYEDQNSLDDSMQGDTNRYLLKCTVKNRLNGTKNVLYLDSVETYTITNNASLFSVSDITFENQVIGKKATINISAIQALNKPISLIGNDFDTLISFENNEKKNGLKIRKSVKGSNDAETEFMFNLYAWYETKEKDEQGVETGDTIYTAIPTDHKVEITDSVEPVGFEKVQYYDTNLTPALYHEAGRLAFQLKANRDFQVTGLPVGSHYAFAEDEGRMPAGYKLAKVEGDAFGVVPDGSEPSAEIVFTNTYIGYYCVAVTKVWDDDNNRDGKRPENLYVNLYQSTTVNGVTTYYDADGKAYVRSGSEGNYTYTYTPAEGETGTEYTRNKPPVYRVASGKDYTAILNDKNSWTYMVRGVPTGDMDGNQFTYTWEEYILGENNIKIYLADKNNGSGYVMTSSVPTQDDTIAGVDGVTVITTLTNKHETEDTTVKAKKIWAGDSNDLYGLRKRVDLRLEGYYEYKVNENDAEPTRFYITDTDQAQYIKTTAPVYLKDGEEVAAGTDGATLADYESVEWTNLPRYVDGHKVIYKVYEVGSVDGYTSSVTKECTYNETTKTWEAEITNTFNKGNLTIDKSVIIDNAPITEAVSGKTFYVEVFRVIDGTTYYVTNANGTLAKESDVTLSTTNGVFALTFDQNTKKYVLNTTDHQIKNLPYGSYIVQEVVNKGTEEAPVWEAVSATNATKLNIENTQFIYEVSKTTDTADMTSAGATAELINTYTNSKYCIAVTKQWQINGQAYVDDTLEAHVQLQRTVDRDDPKTWETVDIDLRTVDNSISGNYNSTAKVLTLNKANNWSAVSVGMPRFDKDGKEYQYQWIEVVEKDGVWVADAPEGWTLSTTTLEKSAHGTGNNEVTLIFLTKLVNERKTGGLQLNKNVYLNGAPDENQSIQNREFVFDITDSKGNPVITLTLKYNQGGTSPVYVWSKKNYTLYENVDFEVRTGGSAINVTGLPIGEVYTITEKTDDGFTVYSSTNKLGFANATEGSQIDEAQSLVSDYNVYRFYNNYEEKTEVPVIKIWNDENNNDGKRPETITVGLYRKVGSSGNVEAVIGTDNKPVTVVLGTANEWTHTFADLPKYFYKADRTTQLITYSVKELDASGNAVAETGDNARKISFDGTVYTVAYDTDDDGTKIITNTYVPEKVTASVYKTWDDNDDQDGKRPATITATLYKNNEATKAEVTLYSKAQTTKPAAVKVKLTDDHDAAKYDAEYSDWDNTKGYTVTVKGLPKYENGDEIVYSWVETLAQTDLNNGYTMSGLETTEDADGNATTHITNSYTPGKFCLTVLKVWDDQSNKYNLRPTDSITVQLWRRDKAIAATGTTAAVEAGALSLVTGYLTSVGGTAVGNDGNVTLTAPNWSAMALAVDKYVSGKEQEYFWKEVSVPTGYTLDTTGALTIESGDNAGTYIPANETTSRIGSIKNTLDTGSIAITKKVTGLPAGADVKHLKFTVTGYKTGTEKNDTNKIYGPESIYLIQFSGPDGEGVYTAEPLIGLPLGDYVVTEDTTGVTVANYHLTSATAQVGSSTAVGLTVANENVSGENTSANVTGTTATLTKGATLTFAFENTYEHDTGDLEVTKEVEGALEGEEDTEFTFTVKFSEQLKATLTGALLALNTTTNTYEAVTDATTGEAVTRTWTLNDQDEITFNLKADQKMTITGIPTGVTYTVTETPASNFAQKSATGTSDVIVKNSVKKADFVNERQTGDLKVTKTVVSSDSNDEDKAFNFTVTFNSDKLAATTYPATFIRRTVTGTGADAVVSYMTSTKTEDQTVAITPDTTAHTSTATFTLKHNESVTITGLPTGIRYTVAEAGSTDARYQAGFTTTYTGETGDIATALSVADFTNTKDEGGLKIEKIVSSSADMDQAKEFRFKVTLKDGSGETAKAVTGTFKGTMTTPITINGTTTTRTYTRDIVFENGEAAYIYLKTGETMTITGIPAGYTYTIAEITDATHDLTGFTTTYQTTTVDDSPVNGTITANAITIVKGEDKTKTTTFTNTRQTADLVIDKTVLSDIPADKTALYEFLVRLTSGDLMASGTYNVEYYESDSSTKALTTEQLTALGHGNLPAQIKF